MLVGGIVVEDHVDDFAHRDVTLERVKKPNELLMPMALHIVPEQFASQYIESRDQLGRAVALVVRFR